MEMLARAAKAGIAPDMDALIAAVPYCAWLGLSARVEAERVVLAMPFDAKLVGNPIIPAIHGGVIGSLLETAAIVQTVWATQSASIPKPTILRSIICAPVAPSRAMPARTSRARDGASSTCMH